MANSDCFVCRKQKEKEEHPPGGYIYEGRYFAVCHAPLDMGSKGTMLVESKRHFLDFGELRQGEGTELIDILRRLFPAMKKSTCAERIYSLAMMDGVPHFHLWLVPWRKGELLRGIRYLATEQIPPSLNEVEETIRQIKEDFQSMAFRR
jgi:diadenosine tetraphosphate (Ap4A) HIT family hydrolase